MHKGWHRMKCSSRFGRSSKWLGIRLDQSTIPRSETHEDRLCRSKCARSFWEHRGAQIKFCLACEATLYSTSTKLRCGRSTPAHLSGFPLQCLIDEVDVRKRHLRNSCGYFVRTRNRYLLQIVNAVLEKRRFWSKPDEGGGMGVRFRKLPRNLGEKRLFLSVQQYS